MNHQLIIEPAPHMRGKDTTQSIMLDVTIALIPTLIAATVIFGARALLLTMVCVVSCVAFEYLFRRLIGRSNTISDFSAVVTGLLLAFNLPATLPVWMAVVGSFVAIVIVKQLFGGIGQNFANPAIVGRIMLMISFTKTMSLYPMPSAVIEKMAAMASDTPNGMASVVGATPLQMMADGNIANMPSLMDLFLGVHGGVLGETCVLTLLLGGAYLIARRVITPVIPLTYIATVFVMVAALGADPVRHILSGGLMLGAFFMATDYSTTPTTIKGQIIFALGCGVITVAIRLYGSYPEGVSFAILIMNIITPLIDRYTKSKPLGGAAK